MHWLSPCATNPSRVLRCTWNASATHFVNILPSLNQSLSNNTNHPSVVTPSSILPNFIHPCYTLLHFIVFLVFLLLFLLFLFLLFLFLLFILLLFLLFFLLLLSLLLFCPSLLPPPPISCFSFLPNVSIFISTCFLIFHFVPSPSIPP